jgi:hypothetical protein
VTDLGPVEVQAAFFFTMGLTITGGKVIHKYVYGIYPPSQNAPSGRVGVNTKRVSTDLRWLEKYEQKPQEDTPIGLILCADKSEEQPEKSMGGKGIRRVQVEAPIEDY